MTKEPKIVNDRFSNDFKDFVSLCLKKDPKQRASAEELLSHKFLEDALSYKKDFVKFICDWKNLDSGEMVMDVLK